MSGNKLRVVIVSVFCISLAVILSSCVSSRRMMKISPFSSAESRVQSAKNDEKVTSKKQEPFVLEVDKERINGWPFLYLQPEFTSILWPFADFDKNGVAVRPFYVQDKNEYAIMFPLAAWNPVNGDGWVLTGYWNKYRNGIFPIYQLGRNFNYVLPVWWTKKYWGGPIWGIARNKGLNVAGPFWYNSENGSFGFFPLMWHKNINKGAFFPLYYYRIKAHSKLILPLFGALGHYYKSGGDSSLMVANYCHSSFSGGDTVNDMFLPLYIYRKVDGRTYFLSPLFASRSESNNNSGWFDALGPIFYRSWDGSDRYTSVMWPFTGFKYADNNSIFYVFPFFCKDDNKKKSSLWAMPYYSEKSKSGKSEIQAVLPFYHYSKSPNFKSLWVFPWYQSKDSGTNVSGVFPLAFYKSEAKDWKVVLPALLASFGNKETNFLFPFINYRYDWRKSFRFWPLVSVNDFPSPILNITKKSVCFLMGLGMYYEHDKNDYRCSEEKLLSALLFMGSRRERETKVNLKYDFSTYQRTGNLESELDYYLLYYRSKKKTRLWDYSKIEHKKVLETIKLWQKFYRSRNGIKTEDLCKDFVAKISDKKKLDASIKRLEKYKAQNAKAKAELTGILKKHGLPVKDDTDKALENGLVEFLEKYSKTENKGWQLLFPFYYSSFRDDESKWNFMLFLANGAKGRDYSTFRILRYFYRQQFQQDKYNYDIFPFINVRGSKNFSKYSFGWRLFSMRKDKKTGKRNGHICFIPF